MKNFIIKLTVFSLLAGTFPVFCFFFADGRADFQYGRFITSRQRSLILGTSRAAQGLQSAIINEYLARDDIYNYAFNNAVSPYGQVYLKSIQKKLHPDAENGVFIFAVNPWSISSKSLDPNDVGSFRERSLALAKTTNPNLKPNIEYLVKSYDDPYINILKGDTYYVHPDGWLELNIPMDTQSVLQRTKDKVTHYRVNNLPAYSYSSIRHEYLIKIIEYLQEHGTVYLVRLPVCSEILDIENELMPNFERRMENLSKELNVDYLSLLENKDQYLYTDGNHLSVESSKKVSELVAKWIRET